jgi:hypothetical protein
LKLSESDDEVNENEIDEAKVNGTLSNKSAKSTPWHKAHSGPGKLPKGGSTVAGGKAKVVKLENTTKDMDEAKVDEVKKEVAELKAAVNVVVKESKDVVTTVKPKKKRNYSKPKNR